MLTLTLTLTLTGCGSLPAAKETPAARLCAGGQCTTNPDPVVAAKLLQGLHRLLARNDGADLALCEADPLTRECTQDDLGYFVLGGLIPGRGSARSATMSEARLDAAQQTLHFRMHMPMRFLGAGVTCAVHSATLRLQPLGRISLLDEDHGCNWMLVGIMKASFGFEVDTVDLERGRISGWWRHRVVGTGNGRGSGYASILFPTPLPVSEATALTHAQPQAQERALASATSPVGSDDTRR